MEGQASCHSPPCMPMQKRPGVVGSLLSPAAAGYSTGTAQGSCRTYTLRSVRRRSLLCRVYTQYMQGAAFAAQQVARAAPWPAFASAERVGGSLQSGRLAAGRMCGEDEARRQACWWTGEGRGEWIKRVVASTTPPPAAHSHRLRRHACLHARQWLSGNCVCRLHNPALHWPPKRACLAAAAAEQGS